MSHTAFQAYNIYKSAMWGCHIIFKRRGKPRHARPGCTLELAMGPKGIPFVLYATMSNLLRAMLAHSNEVHILTFGYFCK